MNEINTWNLEEKMNKAIALWVHPRSLSTAMERIFMERGDFEILHEPFSYLYYFHEKRAPIPYGHEDPNHPHSYPDIKEYILSNAEKTPVYFKDMCFHCYDHLIKDDEFLKRITSTFLIRDPEKTILSHYKINPDVTSEEIGFELELNIFEKVKELTGKTPALIDADDLEDDPERVVKAYCEAVGIKYLPESLHWDSGHKKEWDSWKEWHTDAAQSTGIQKNMEKFDISLDDKPHLREYYKHHKPFYDYMYAERIGGK